MIRFFIIFFTAVVTSLYFFPFEFIALPGVNTKMAMAVVGILICMYQLTQKREFNISKDLLLLSLISFGISLIAYFSVVYNNTPDYSYVTYFISMFVWLSAAFVVCKLIKKVHEKITIELLCHYLIAVCVAQCILALVIDYVPTVRLKSFWILEAKPGHPKKMNVGDMLQAYLYATHPEIQVPYIVLCNGWELEIFYIHQIENWKEPIFTIDNTNCAERFSELREILSVDSILDFQRKRLLEQIKNTFEVEIDI